MHPAELEPERLLEACLVRRQRRSGPGGQHRNKVETGIVLVHQQTGTRAEATERRSQAENQAVALARLRVNLALSVRSLRPPDSVPSPRWARRTAGRRLAVSTGHADFPALLAEALDVLAAVDYQLAEAADRLGVSASQLVKLLSGEPRGLDAVNHQRAQRGLRPLHARP